MHPFWQQIFGNREPTVYFCEEATVQIISRPGYFVSNIPYILLGLFLLFTQKNTPARLIGISSIITGSFSALYDASYSFYAQIFDLMGMLILINIIIYLSLKPFANQFYLVSVLILNQFVYLILALVIQGRIGQIWFGVSIITYLLIESVIYFKRKTDRIGKYLLAALGVFTISFAFWLPDGLHLFCSPFDWLQGRGIFHYGTTLVIFLLYQYYNSEISDKKPT